MKKRLLGIITLALSLLCVSCEKTPTATWTRFYGFTKADVIGSYEANTDPSVYAELPTEGVVVYNNASIQINELSDDMVSLHINIPDKLNKNFTGTVPNNDYNSELGMNNYHEDILFTVYKNDKNQVRLHGRYRYCYYEHIEGVDVLADTDNYGFDVIKTNNQ